MSIENQPIYPNGANTPEWGIGYHNVGKGVLRASDEYTMRTVSAHYGLRCGHIPPAKEIGVLVANLTLEIAAQMNYLSGKIRREIHIFTAGEPLPGGTVINPYINTPDVAEAANGSEHIAIWGLPQEMVMLLKDKSFSNPDINNKNREGVTGLRTPDHEVHDIDNMVENGIRFARQIQDKYESVGLANKYPVGIMLRAAESDGGYGNIELVETARGIRLVPNGEEENEEYFGNWNEALSRANSLIKESINLEVNRNVVMGRLIDYEDMPGLSVIIHKGQVYSLGWNGQTLNKNGKATVGTTRFEARPNTYAEQSRQINEEKSAEDFANYLQAVARGLGVDFNDITAVCNVDLIIPGECEREFLRRTGKDPDIVYAAEINPRWTNWTDALSLVAWIEKADHSTAGYRGMVERNVITVDKQPHRANSADALRNNVEGINESMAREGRDGHIVVRMPGDKNAGLVFFGDVEGVIEARRRSLEQL